MHIANTTIIYYSPEHKSLSFKHYVCLILMIIKNSEHHSVDNVIFHV